MGGSVNDTYTYDGDDHLGSTAAIASGDGKVIEWETDYYPFGNQRKVFTSSVNNQYQFTGYEYDSDTGYDYAVARFEAGAYGLFLSPDPYLGSIDVTDAQSLNRYTYVENDPTDDTDPLGLVKPEPGLGAPLFPGCIGDPCFAPLLHGVPTWRSAQIVSTSTASRGTWKSMVSLSNAN